MLSEEYTEIVGDIFIGGEWQTHDLQPKIVALEEQLKIEKQKHEDTANWALEQQNRADTSGKREAVLREAFETASQRVSVGRAKRLMFRCMHCKKDTPLMIDGLLDLANKALKEPAEDGDEIQNQDQAARSNTG